MSSAERQRRFRARNPGYNKKYRGHPTAAQRGQISQAFAERYAQVEAHVQLVLRSTLCRPLALMLPAPVEPLTETLTETLVDARVGVTRAAEPVLLSRAA
jgi:hypothetical protein